MSRSKTVPEADRTKTVRLTAFLYNGHLYCRSANGSRRLISSERSLIKGWWPRMLDESESFSSAGTFQRALADVSKLLERRPSIAGIEAEMEKWDERSESLHETIEEFGSEAGEEMEVQEKLADMVYIQLVCIRKAMVDEIEGIVRPD